MPVMIRFFRKYHKWLGIIYALIILGYVFSGIILNHRETFSAIDVDRRFLPRTYRYQNWNNAAVKAACKLSPDSILLYGNIGIWLTDSCFSAFSGFNEGFPKGIDNRKVYHLTGTKRHGLVAATFSGLYSYDAGENKWVAVRLPVKDKRVTCILEQQDTLLLLTRSFLLKSSDLEDFTVVQLPPPENYDGKANLFKTLWVIHSGEIYGLPGKLIIDSAGLVFAFLTITGLIVFFNKILLRGSRNRLKGNERIKMSARWNLKWHNRLGWTMLLILVINTLTGMFLRPPLLAFIGHSRVSKIPGTALSAPNPWFDQLRRILYDRERNRHILSTSEGFYYSDDRFRTELKKFVHQPPASIMGVTVLEKTGQDCYLVGSFEGLFTWNPQTGELFDYIKKQPHTASPRAGKPIGDHLVSGYIGVSGHREFYFDYNQGVTALRDAGRFADMPEPIINHSPMSLWNVALEIHTGRIWQPLIGDLYVLVVPITGLIVLFILISGFVVWLRTRKPS